MTNQPEGANEAMAIIGRAMDELAQLMPPIEAARLMTYHATIGLTSLGGTEEVMTIVPKAVAKVAEAREG